MRTSPLVAAVLALGCRGGAAAPPAAPAPASSPATTACGAAPAALDACGERHLAAGRLDQAERAWREALRRRADFAPAHDGLAMIRFHRGDATGGLAELEAGLAVAAGADPAPRIRLLENLAWAHMLAGREEEAFRAVAASVDAQALETPAATAGVTRIGRARLLLLAGAWDRALVDARAARTGEVPGYVGWVSRALEARALAGAGAIAAADDALAALVAEVGAAHPLTLDPRLDIALARGDLDAAATVAASIGAQDPYAGERAQLALATALTRAGRAAEAAPLLDQVAARHLRSVGSAHIRRAAAAMRAAAVTDPAGGR